MPPQPSLPNASLVELSLAKMTSFPGMRALAWSGDMLYASLGYEVLSARLQQSLSWQTVATFQPSAWRKVTSKVRITSRLVRDGFHALSVLKNGCIIGAIPGAIVTRSQGAQHFEITHMVTRGTRPLHITATPEGCVYWGEYFDNRDRSEVFIYASTDNGQTWSVAYTFPAKAIRHVHNIVHDPWQHCLWILTGDYGQECRILRASYDLSNVDAILEGNQQARAVALLPAPDALYFASDTPLEENHIYRLDRRGHVEKVAVINNSSIYGCAVRSSHFFSTMVEPSQTNLSREVHLYGSPDGVQWLKYLAWEKDLWPQRFFQYGNAFLPDGTNETDFLAITTIAVKGADLETGLWRVNSTVVPRE